MRGLTLTAPYGTLIALAEKFPELGKHHETRSRPFHYRGWLAIHQGKNLKPVGGLIGLQALCADEPFKSAIEPEIYEERMDGQGQSFPVWDLNRLPLGKIVALANYTACYQVGRGGKVMYDLNQLHVSVPLPAGNDFAFGNYAPRRYALKLEQIRALPEPIPYRGSQGLWIVPEGVQAAIWSQLR